MQKSSVSKPNFLLSCQETNRCVESQANPTTMPHPRIIPWKWGSVSLDQALPYLYQLLKFAHRYRELNSANQCAQLVFENIHFAQADERYEIIFSVNKVSYLATISNGRWYLEFLLHGPNTESLWQLEASWQHLFEQMFDLEFAVVHTFMQPREQ